MGSFLLCYASFMCGRYYRTGDKQLIAEAFRADLPEGLPALAAEYNIGPTTTQPIVREGRDTGRRELAAARWGLVGFGSPGPDRKLSTFNARAETLTRSSLWRTPLHKRRCLVPISGFYEWGQRAGNQPTGDAVSAPLGEPPGYGVLKLPAKVTADMATHDQRASTQARRTVGTSTGERADLPDGAGPPLKAVPNSRKHGASSASQRVPFRFSLRDHEFFAVAGLWDAWKAPDGGWLQSFTIITVQANAVLGPFHDRMPALLAPAAYAEWLDRGEVERPPVHLLRRDPGADMVIHQAHAGVGNIRNQGPELLNSL